MTAAAFEARSCPTLPNEIKKTKLYNYAKPAAGINFLLGAVGLRHPYVHVLYYNPFVVYLI